jgi:hypothetical protein
MVNDRAFLAALVLGNLAQPYAKTLLEQDQFTRERLEDKLVTESLVLVDTLVARMRPTPVEPAQATSGPQVINFDDDELPEASAR